MLKNKQKNRLSLEKHHLLLAFTILYFLTFGIFMAHTSGQPDQAPHSYISRQFSQTWGIPEDNPDSQYIITGQPYLYYWINGAVYKIYRQIFPNGNLHPTLLWRLVSVLYSTFTVFFTYKLAKKVSGNPFIGVLSAFLLSNTLMFVYVSGGISYDNLMNLAAIASIYHLVCVFKKEDFIRHTMLTGIWVVIGSLAKDQYLLLALIIFLIWIFFIIRNFKQIELNFNKTNIFLSIIFVVFLCLFVGLYGNNLIEYSRITPLCYQLRGIGQCRTYDYRYEYYEPFNLQWMWFVRDNLSDPFRYAFTFWIYKMMESIWGILSHNSFIPIFSVSLHGILLVWALFSLVKNWKFINKLTLLLISILVAYAGYVFLWNYKREVEFNFQHYVVTGRYLLPIVGVLQSIIIIAFMKIRNNFLRRMSIAMAIIIYFSGGLGMFLSRYSEVFTHWRLYY